ncbi:DUF4852 domain-containing protein [Prevotella sp. 10(H)]|uniref:DUF4852 domain-containing protein n=1 Tax=Prevotella sp. 10(H) TaxID=1158294 RepID=UPI0004A711E8|nr:DUF4852 domain-containing protein [Prevotella sp. 10(H)]
MKRFTTILFLLTVFASSLFPQLNSVELFDGRILKNGDIIQAGYRANYNKYIYIRTMRPDIKDQFFGYENDISYSKLQVTDIKISDDVHKVITVQTRELSTNKVLYVEINPAIQDGEIIVYPAKRLYPDAKHLSDDLMMAFCLRVNKLEVTDEVLLSYIVARDKELGKKCRTDEFEFNSVKPEYSKMLHDAINNFDFSSVYYFDKNVDIVKYDFDRNGYQLHLIDVVEQDYIKYGDYSFLVLNFDAYSLIPVSPEDGKKINKLRQGRSSIIDNRGYGRYYFRLIDKQMEIKSRKYLPDFIKDILKKTLMGAELAGIEVYNYPHCEYNFIGSKK